MSADSASPPFIAGLRCLRCGRTFPADYAGFLCPDHANAGSDLGTLDVLYDLEHSIYTSGAGGVIELGINVLTLALSVWFARWAWRRRHALLAFA